MWSPRPYQRDTFEAAKKDYVNGVRRQLWVHPTGAGKGDLIGYLPSAESPFRLKPGFRMLVIVHRDILVQDLAERLRRFNPDKSVAIEAGSDTASPDSDIVVASVQSLGRLKEGDDAFSPRLKRINPDKVAICLIDEAHRAVSPQYLGILWYLEMLKGKQFRPDDRRLLVGTTATPERADNVALEMVFDKVTYNKPLIDMIREGWLMDPECHQVRTSIDISKVKVRAGEFAPGELDKLLNNPARNRMIVEKYKEITPGLPAIAFTTSVAHSKDLAAEFETHGLTARAMHGELDKGLRDEYLELFSRGSILVLTSCDLISEGVNVPSAAVALMTRPVRSGLLYRQQIGRILRKQPSPEEISRGAQPKKQRAVIIDFCDLSGTHTISNIPSIMGLRKSFNFEGKKLAESMGEIQTTLTQKPTLRLADFDSLSEAKMIVQKVDILSPPVVPKAIAKITKNLWLERFHGIYNLTGRFGTFEVYQNALGMWELAKSRSGFTEVLSIWESIGEAIATADAMVPKEDIGLTHGAVKWRREPPTENQCIKLFSLEPSIRAHYPSSDAFYRSALTLYWKGQEKYSRGSISLAIDAALLSRERQKEAAK